MKNQLITAVLVAVILFGSQIAFSGETKEGHSHAVHSMAEVMLHLNHYPNDSEKEILRKIGKDVSTSSMERVVINAIVALQHRVSNADKGNLEKIMKDDSAKEDIRELANIVYHLNHMPTASDKTKLKRLMK